MKKIEAIIRPHLLEIHGEADGAGCFRAQVTHVHAAGPIVKVELRTESGQIVRVDVPQDRFRARDVWRGAEVFVAPRTEGLFIEIPAESPAESTPIYG